MRPNTIDKLLVLLTFRTEIGFIEIAARAASGGVQVRFLLPLPLPLHHFSFLLPSSLPLPVLRSLPRLLGLRPLRAPATRALFPRPCVLQELQDPAPFICYVLILHSTYIQRPSSN
jgi:hypothetical protein